MPPLPGRATAMAALAPPTLDEGSADGISAEDYEVLAQAQSQIAALQDGIGRAVSRIQDALAAPPKHQTAPLKSSGGAPPFVGDIQNFQEGVDNNLGFVGMYGYGLKSGPRIVPDNPTPCLGSIFQGASF